MVFQTLSSLCFPITCCKILKIKGHLWQKPSHSQNTSWMKPSLLFGSMAVQNKTFHKWRTMSRTAFYWPHKRLLPYGLQVNTQCYNDLFHFVFCAVLKIIQEGSWAWSAQIGTLFVLSTPQHESGGRLGKPCLYSCRGGTQHHSADEHPHGLCRAAWGQGSLPRQMPFGV